MQLGGKVRGRVKGRGMCHGKRAGRRKEFTWPGSRSSRASGKLRRTLAKKESKIARLVRIQNVFGACTVGARETGDLTERA